MGCHFNGSIWLTTTLAQVLCRQAHLGNNELLSSSSRVLNPGWSAPPGNRSSPSASPQNKCNGSCGSAVQRPGYSTAGFKPQTGFDDTLVAK